MNAIYQTAWLDIGRRNPWIRLAADPPFDDRSFCECTSDAELLDKFEHGNWSLGTAFHIGDLCFIQQDHGGDEWLTIREAVAFESISFGNIIEGRGRDAARAILDRIRKATIEQCKTLTY